MREVIQEIDVGYWDNYLTFWKRGPEGEIDALIDFPEHTIGIEVKYLSGLSSDDGVSLDENSLEDIALTLSEDTTRQSNQQLARESRMVSRVAKDKTAMLLFIADEGSVRRVYEDTTKRNILQSGVTLGIVTWQDILAALDKVSLQVSMNGLLLRIW